MANDDSDCHLNANDDLDQHMKASLGLAVWLDLHLASLDAQIFILTHWGWEKRQDFIDAIF